MTTPIIDIISTGSGCPEDTLQKAATFIESLGFEPRYSEKFFDDHPLYICNDEQRFANLKQALYAPDSDFIWCLRGGSGTSRLLPELLDLKPPKKQKTLLGFSDVTALHLFLTQHWGWKALHGPTLTSFALTGTTEPVKEHLLDLLKHQKTDITLPLTPLGNPIPPSLTAPITGGNLALIQMSIGTPWQLESKDKILFFEDINEAPYRVAEMLNHLKNAGIFKEARAILFGDFFQEKPGGNDGELIDFVLKDFAQSLAIPVFKDFATGHIKNNHPIQLNARATLSQQGGHITYQQKIRL